VSLDEAASFASHLRMSATREIQSDPYKSLQFQGKESEKERERKRESFKNVGKESEFM